MGRSVAAPLLPQQSLSTRAVMKHQVVSCKGRIASHAVVGHNRGFEPGVESSPQHW